VVFTLYHFVLHWLEQRPMKVPEDIGLIQLEWRESRPDIAGMHQHNDVTGEAAVDMVISQIHNNEAGIPKFPRATLIGATWIDGRTVQDKIGTGRRADVLVRSAPAPNSGLGRDGGAGG
jgi:LacI family transcriptional regulator